MDLLLVPIPIFNKLTAVEAYLFRYRIFEGENSPRHSPLLEALNKGGLDAFTGGKPLFVPVSSELLLCEPERQCRQEPGKVVFLVENEVPLQSPYLSSIAILRQLGFKMALSARAPYTEPNTLLGIMDYLVLDSSIRGSTRRQLIQRYQKANADLNIVATGLATQQAFDEAIAQRADFYEGQFYTVPVTVGDHRIKPLKANLIHLLNIVRDENFEFEYISSIVQRDPALSVSLMRFINSPFLGLRHKIKTIHHAVTILGQEEVRKWVTAAVFRSLGTDRPGELVRLSLVRAKFMENLAPLFRMQRHSQSLFLAGLFSALDVILQTTMEDALEIVYVSDEIWDALMRRRGSYYPVVEIMYAYERAEWDQVMELAQARELPIEDLYNAYIEAISWYNELISEHVRPNKRG